MSERKLSGDVDGLLRVVSTFLEEFDAERDRLTKDLATVRGLLKMADADKAAETKRADEAEARLAAASVVADAPLEPWIADVRSGVLAVYRGPQRNCTYDMDDGDMLHEGGDGPHGPAGWRVVSNEQAERAKWLAATLNAFDERQRATRLAAGGEGNKP